KVVQIFPVEWVLEQFMNLCEVRTICSRSKTQQQKTLFGRVLWLAHRVRFYLRRVRKGIKVIEQRFCVTSRNYSLTLSTARNASWGISTRPTFFMRFLPSFCFSSSLRLRLMSPP